MEIHSRLSFIALYLTHIGGPCHLVNHLTKLISMNIEYPQVPTATDHLCLCVIGAKFSSGPKELKSVNSRLQIRRRRRGSTSPPLVCIEPNPGPKSKARRWRPKKKPATGSYISPEQSEQIVAMLNQLEPYETIARKVGCSVKAVKLRDKRLEADGSVEMKKGGRSKRLCQKRVQLSKRPRTPPKKKAKHSQVTPEEKGAIRYGVMHGDSNCTVAKAIGRDEATVRLWKDRLQATGKMERKTGSGRKRITTEREDRALVENSLKDEESQPLNLEMMYEA